MSVIDWESHPEPWRSMGLGFVKELAGETPSQGVPRESQHSPRLWHGKRIRALVRARDVDGKRWKVIADEFNGTPHSCMQAYRRYLAANPVLR